jgi:ribosome recycling factor
MMEDSYYEQIKAENIAAAQRRINFINAHIENLDGLYNGQEDALRDIRMIISGALKSDDKDKAMTTVSVLTKTVKSLQNVIDEEINQIDEHVKQMKAIFFHIK